ncbi:MAG: ubiquinone biosynthesis protein [Rhizobacter sp.]
MDRFIGAALSYPTAIFTALLLVVLVYWLLALVGFVDFESTGLDLEVELQADGDPGELSTLAGYAVAMGLHGVPFSIVVSILVLLSWTLCCLAGQWVLASLGSGFIFWVSGTVILLLSLAASIPLTALLIRPMRGLFFVHHAVGNAGLVGQTCVVLSQRVDDRFGRAAVIQQGTNVHIRVWTQAPQTLVKGDKAQIVAYNETTRHYLVRPSPDALL